MGLIIRNIKINNEGMASTYNCYQLQTLENSGVWSFNFIFVIMVAKESNTNLCSY